MFSSGLITCVMAYANTYTVKEINKGKNLKEKISTTPQKERNKDRPRH